MDASSDVLGHLYKKVLHGALPEHDSRECASSLTPLLPSEGCLAVPSRWDSDPGGQDPAQPACPAAPLALRGPSPKSGAHEQVLLQLTVIQVLVTRVTSAETEPGCKEKYREILNILCESSEVDLKLTSLVFGSRDKLVSHLAAKCLALLLFFQLGEKILLRESWVAFCRTSLGGSWPSGRVTCCLWVLSAVIKEILKDPDAQKTERLQRFLAPLDATLEEFCEPFFAQCLESLCDPSEGINALLTFLDLLELLVASRPYLEPPLPCQRLLFQKSAHLLAVITRPIPAFVRRKCVLVLKKCLLGKVGEDLGRHLPPAPLPPDAHLEADMSALADVVLQAVDSGLLRTLPVQGRAPHFGGEEVQPGAAHAPGADQVVLRAASLLVLKSLEVTFRRPAAASPMRGDLRRVMAQLLSFLNPHLQPALPCDHPCAWLSRVFIEQDDDMLEAAKASLGIYLQLTRAGDPSGEDRHQGRAAWACDTHGSGCDPHCIFLSVLGSVGFDPTTLLDFLISSETCFLEYFVRYLRLLQTDWAHFATVCAYWDGLTGEVDASDDERGPSQTRARHCPADPDPGAAGSGQGNVGVTSPTPLRPTQLAQSPCSVTPSLVAYDSSDDSEGEMPGQRFTDVERRARPQTQGTVQVGQGAGGLGRGPRSTPAAPRDPAAHFPAARSSASGSGLCCTAVRCLGRLHRAVARLQKRSLFPYNPAALLKLLRHVEAISRQRGAQCQGGLSPAATGPLIT